MAPIEPALALAAVARGAERLAFDVECPVALREGGVIVDAERSLNGPVADAGEPDADDGHEEESDGGHGHQERLHAGLHAVLTGVVGGHERAEGTPNIR